MVGKEAVEVDGEGTVFFIFFKAYGFKEAFVLFVGNFTDVGSEVHAAEVDKVKRTSAEHEKCLEIEAVDGGCEVIDKPALIRELKLANASQLTVNSSRISEKVGVIFYVTAKAYLLLLRL